MKRRAVREKVVQALYAHEMSGDSVDHVVDTILPGLKPNPNAYGFARDLVVQTIAHKEEIDLVIRKKVANWDFRRIAVLDRLILRMGICELMYFDDIPPKVTMNEAIELARLFSTQRSGEFVNGVLDGVLTDMKASGGLSKTGRGLFEGEPRNRTTRPKVTKAP